MINISEDLQMFIVNNCKEVSIIKNENKYKLLQVTITKSDIMKNELLANMVTEMSSWFMFNVTSGSLAYLDLEKYAEVVPYQFYATVPFEGIDPCSQVYVFQFTFQPKIQIKKVERKSLLSKLKKYIGKYRELS